MTAARARLALPCAPRRESPHFVDASQSLVVRHVNVSFVETHGDHLEYDVHGDADRPALLLLHALGSSLAMWDTQLARLAPHFRIVRCSLRGHGGSRGAVPGEPDVAAFAADTLAVLDALDIERAHWCGLSFGGMIAMWAAAHAPGRVARLVLSNTTPWMGPARNWDERIALVRARGLAPLADATMERWFTPDFRAREAAAVARIRGIFLATDPQGYIAACGAIRDMDQRSQLTSIRAPTIVISGSKDTGTPATLGAQLCSAIDGARHVVLDAAHLSCIEAADAWAAAAIAHLGTN